MRGCLDQQTNRVVEWVGDTILVVFDLHHFEYRVNSIVHVKAVENVVLGHVGNCLLVKAPILGVTVSIKPEGTQYDEGMLA